MPGLTRKCKQGSTFKIGEATIRIIKIGRKVTLNIIAPDDVPIQFAPSTTETRTTQVTYQKHLETRATAQESKPRFSKS